MNFTLVTTLLCISWISVSVCQFHTVEVQSGEEVTLTCTNYSSMISRISWFKMDNKSNVSNISSMSRSDDVVYCDEFQNDKFNMSSNITTLFLNINPVDLSDSGLYFCGVYTGDNPRYQVIYTATYIKMQEMSDEPTSLTTAIFGGLIVFLILIIIVQTVKIRKLHTANQEEQNPQHSRTPELTYADPIFHQKTKRSRRSGLETELEQDVVYSTLN